MTKRETCKWAKPWVMNRVICSAPVPQWINEQRDALENLATKDQCRICPCWQEKEKTDAIQA